MLWSTTSVIPPNAAVCRLRPVFRKRTISCSDQVPRPVRGSPRRLVGTQPSIAAPPARKSLPSASPSARSCMVGARGV